MTKAQKKARMARCVEALKSLYPDAECALEYKGDPWRLLVMGRLSAQCTDARVNIVCKELFAKYPNASALAAAKPEDVAEIVRPCGLYRLKAANIIDASRMLQEEFGGVLPRTMEELLRFPGVGRKIANLLLGDVYHIPSVVTDTHCIRICGRLGAYPEKEKRPLAVERILTELLPPLEASDFCHRLVWFGREICTARSPKCHLCPLGGEGLCAKREKENGK